jgi:hypothetical protein
MHTMSAVLPSWQVPGVMALGSHVLHGAQTVSEVAEQIPIAYFPLGHIVQSKQVMQSPALYWPCPQLQSMIRYVDKAVTAKDTTGNLCVHQGAASTKLQQ